MRARLASLGIMLLWSLSAASDATESRFEGVAEVMTNQLGALSRIQPRGASQRVTVYFREDATRIEFNDSTGARYALLLPAGAAAGWIVGATGGLMPVPGMRWPLHFDPVQPCAGQGMFANCQAGEAGTRAGRAARQWRYRLTNATGPGSTRQGTMWLDQDTGLVLAYTGQTGLQQQQRWEVQRVTYGPQPDALFQPPQRQP